MSEELKFKIGGVGISIKWQRAQIIDWPHPYYQDFISSDKADVNLRIHCDHLPEYSKDKMLFDGEREGYWKLYCDESRYIIEIYDTMTNKKSKVCLMEPDFSSGDVYIEPELERLHLPSSVAEPFRVRRALRKLKPSAAIWLLPLLMQPLVELIIVNLLAKKQGIMVHGLGINDRGRGIALLGGTGTGKSTMAEFYKNEERVNILSDEHIIIKKYKDKFLLYGTPWPGMAAAALSESVPLKRIFFIEHAPVNKILGRGTMRDLLPLLFLPFWDRERMDLILEVCEDLISKINCKKLGFVKDKTVVEFIRKRK
ncbi:MAG: hypothetical protein QMD71_01040 [bacterium]|nr:hypothetical protein [bacterium]